MWKVHDNRLRFLSPPGWEHLLLIHRTEVMRALSLLFCLLFSFKLKSLVAQVGLEILVPLLLPLSMPKLQAGEYS